MSHLPFHLSSTEPEVDGGCGEEGRKEGRRVSAPDGKEKEVERFGGGKESVNGRNVRSVRSAPKESGRWRVWRKCEGVVRGEEVLKVRGKAA